MKQLIPYLICFFCGLILYIIYQLRKVQILKYISRYAWGVRIIKNEYFNTMFNREKRRLKRMRKAVELAKMKRASTNLKHYVIEYSHGRHLVCTMNEFNVIKKKYKELRPMWPPRDSVFQTR